MLSSYDPQSWTKVDDDIKGIISNIRTLRAKAGEAGIASIDLFDRQINELQEVLDKLSEEPPEPHPTPIPDEILYGLLKKKPVTSKNQLFHSPYTLLVFTDLDQAKTAETAAISQEKAAQSKHYPTLYRIVLEPVSE